MRPIFKHCYMYLVWSSKKHYVYELDLRTDIPPGALTLLMGLFKIHDDDVKVRY